MREGEVELVTFTTQGVWCVVELCCVIKWSEEWRLTALDDDEVRPSLAKTFPRKHLPAKTAESMGESIIQFHKGKCGSGGWIEREA